MLALNALLAVVPVPTFDGTARTPAKLAFVQDISVDEEDLFILRPKHERELVLRSGHVEKPKWSSDGRRLAFMTSYGISIYDEVTGHTKQVVEFQATTSAREYAWSPNGRFVVYGTETGSNRPDYKLYAYDLSTGRSRKLSHGDHLVGWDKAGKRLLVSSIYPSRQWDDFDRGDGSAPYDIVLLDATFRVIRRITKDGWYTGARWLPHSELLFEHLSTEPADGAGHPTHFFIRNLVGGKRRYLKLPWDVEGYWIAVSPDGRKLAATAIGHGSPVLYIVDLATGRSRVVMKEVYGSELAWSKNGRFLFFEKMSRDPMAMQAQTVQLFRLNVKTGLADQISHQPEMYGRFEYDDSRGTVMFEQRGTIYLADGKKGVVVLGSPSGTGTGDIAAWWPKR